MNWMVIKRVMVAGTKNFLRGGAVSAATVLVMTTTLGIISSLIFLSGLLGFTLNLVKEKVDISVYFVRTASEGQILEVKEQLEKLPQVSSIVYTSADEALTAFRSRHANDQLTLQALDELGSNPLDASLSVRAKDPSQYESIINFLEASPTLSGDGASIVDRINYEQNKPTLDRLSLAITATRQVGLAVIFLFALASILIAFATIRLAIYTSKEEIAVMKLVGASNAYVQAPFIFEGIITGTISALIVLVALWPITWYVGSETASWFGGFHLGSYYASHFPLIFIIILGSGVLLGAVASIFAIRKYLKV
jgi:cell division transport system permease protein